MTADEVEHIHDAAVARGERSYFDPRSGLFVMTRLAHLDRGYCCESGCRHCPFRNWTVK